MALLIYLLALGLHDIVFGLPCAPNVPQQESFSKKLVNDLVKCGYAKFEPPEEPDSPLATVNVRFILKYFSLNSDKHVLILQLWQLISWKDSRLKFDPVEYGGLEEIDVDNYNIWIPDFRIYNIADIIDDVDVNYFHPCNVKHTGSVYCRLRIPLLVHCNIKLSDYPYDAQTCNFVFGAMNPNSGYNISFGSKAMSALGAEYGSTWLLSDIHENVQNISDRVRLNLTLMFEREALGLAAIIIYPASIISSLSVACLLLDVRLTERLMLTCFGIFCHFYWLQELSANLPKLSEDSPRIIVYYRGSFVIIVFILIITFVLSVMCRKESAPHNIVIFYNKLVYGSYTRFLVYPRWDVPQGSKFNEDWTNFANIVNSVCLKVIVFSYISLYVAFVPQPIHFN